MHSNLLLRKPTDSKLYVEDVFSTYLYAGTGATQTLTTGIDTSTNGGLIWLKSRDGAYQNFLVDSSTSFQKYMGTNLTSAQTNGLYSGLYAVASTTSGFTLNPWGGSTNASGFNYASWTFRKAPKFFDVVTYTGNGTNNRTISHSLGAVPGMIIVKSTSATGSWYVYHRALPTAQDEYLVLNSTAASVTTGGVAFGAPTSTTFMLEASGGNGRTNATGVSYVAYLFAHDTTADGVIQCGSFTKDGSSNASVTLGWEPQYVLVKSTNGTGSAVGDSWLIADIMRGASESLTNYLRANTSDADATNGGPWCVPTATGFKIQGLSGGSNHIYLAIRRGPMRVPTDATKVFSPVTAASGTPKTTFTSGFPPDAVTYIDRGGIFNRFAPRLTGNGYIEIPSTSPEALTGQYWDQQTQFSFDSATGYNIINYAFLRAPGFFDVVCYTGTGVARTVSHNLGVAPELIIVKGRSQASGNWVVYNATLGNDKRVFLNGTAASGVNTAIWNAVSPTSSVFTVGTSSDVNGSGNTYVAYLFASCPGVSKVGSYTGTGATQTISCGFTGGARYVLIKRTDSTGSWWVWDTARGMVAGTDPRLALNFTNAEANANWVYTTTGGFQIVTSDTSINASGGTYIYLAIA